MFASLVHDPSLTEDDVNELSIDEAVGVLVDVPPFRNGILFLKMRNRTTITIMTIRDLPLSSDESPPDEALSEPESEPVLPNNLRCCLPDRCRGLRPVYLCCRFPR